MKRISPGDCVAVSADDRYYYSLILDNIRLFGGNWAYVFHATTKGGMAAAGEVLGPEKSGFHAFVDFIWAKQEDRLHHIAKRVDLEPYNSVRYLKNTHDFVGKAPLWFITDMQFQEVKRVTELTAEEKNYPFPERIDDTIMVQRVDQQWKPNMDPRL